MAIRGVGRRVTTGGRRVTRRRDTAAPKAAAFGIRPGRPRRSPHVGAPAERTRTRDRAGSCAMCATDSARCSRSASQSRRERDPSHREGTHRTAGRSIAPRARPTNERGGQPRRPSRLMQMLPRIGRDRRAVAQPARAHVRVREDTPAGGEGQPGGARISTTARASLSE